MADDGLLEAVRGLHLAHPELGPKPLLAKLREQQPDLAAGNKEVREALAALKAERNRVCRPAISAIWTFYTRAEIFYIAPFTIYSTSHLDNKPGAGQRLFTQTVIRPTYFQFSPPGGWRRRSLTSS